MLAPYGWGASTPSGPATQAAEEPVKKRAAQAQIHGRGGPGGEITDAPWQGQTYGGSSIVADGKGTIRDGRDRDTDFRVIDLAVGSLAK